MIRDITRIANETYNRHTGTEPEDTQQSIRDPEPHDVYLLGVDYDEFKPETYRGVTLSRGTEEVKRWSAKGYNQDWVDATNWCGEENLSPVMLLSSVHSYNQDVAKKRTA